MPVADEQKVCPWCGEPVVSEGEIWDGFLANRPPDDWICPWCMRDTGTFEGAIPVDLGWVCKTALHHECAEAVRHDGPSSAAEWRRKAAEYRQEARIADRIADDEVRLVQSVGGDVGA
jgi:hypothetical protein